MHRGQVIAAGVGLLAAIVTLWWLMPSVPEVAPPAPDSEPEATEARAPSTAPAPADRSAPQQAAEPPAPADRSPGEPKAAPAPLPSRGNMPGPGGRHLPKRSYMPDADAVGPGALPPAPAGDGGEEGDDAGGAGGDFDDPGAEVEADWLEDTMEGFLDAVVPEKAGAGLSRSCSSDGRSCTFEGDITDDSFMKRGFAAQADGAVDLQGVTLSELDFVETDDGRRFSFTATAP